MLFTDLSFNTTRSYEKNPDDENRLFYVGATRTKEHLHILDHNKMQQRIRSMTNKDIFGTTYKSLQEQVGGKHYQKYKIQPAEFINENKLLFAEGNAIKYIIRHLKRERRRYFESNTLFRNDIREGLLSDTKTYLVHR